MDDSASIFCARVMRGTDSIEKVVTPRAASFAINSVLRAGLMKVTSVEPVWSKSASSPAGPVCGSRTLTTMSALANRSFTSPRTVAPAAV